MPTRTAPAFDAHLLARMTGQLGDRQTTEQRAGLIAAAMCEPLEQGLMRIGIETVGASRGTVRLGLRSELEGLLAKSDVVCGGAIAGWSSDITIAVPGAFIVAFVEALLGGEPDLAAAKKRTPSDIERHTSIVFFEQVVDALKTVATAPTAIATAGEPLLRGAIEEENEAPDLHSALVTLDLAFGTQATKLSLILPQATLIKTEIAPLRPPRAPSESRRPEWAEQLERQITRSHVTLRARIDLVPMTLGALANLQPGDILPFADEGDVRVRLDANGRTIHVCELGRSGSRFMVRLKGGESLEDAAGGRAG
ncbi:MAG: FliM/FliN family flagellar motor switch protein [Pararhizobium sp.]